MARRLTSVILISSLTLGFSVWGLTVLPLDLPQMTRAAGKIFVGRCLDSSPGLDEHGMPATDVRFEVLKGIKGVHTGEEILIKQYGTTRGPLQVREGERALVPFRSMRVSGRGYRSGGEYLLFLYPESRLGFTSPVGGGQGLFEVVPQGDGVQSVVNPLDNRFLKGFSLPPEGGGIDLDLVVGRIERLVVQYE